MGGGVTSVFGAGPAFDSGGGVVTGEITVGWGGASLVTVVVGDAGAGAGVCLAFTAADGTSAGIKAGVSLGVTIGAGLSRLTVGLGGGAGFFRGAELSAGGTACGWGGSSTRCSNALKVPKQRPQRTLPRAILSCSLVMRKQVSQWGQCVYINTPCYE